MVYNYIIKHIFNNCLNWYQFSVFATKNISKNMKFNYVFIESLVFKLPTKHTLNNPSNYLLYLSILLQTLMSIILYITNMIRRKKWKISYHKRGQYFMLTTQGVLRWPLSTFKQVPVWQSMIFTVWSPLQAWKQKK